MKFYVNGLEWKIKYEDGDRTSLNGEDSTPFLGITDYITSTILIRNGMEKGMTRSAVIHELCHCFAFCYGFRRDSYDNEALCDIMGAHADSIIEITNRFLSNKSTKENE